MAICWKSDLDKYVLAANFERRGWIETDSFEDADVLWASIGGPTLVAIFGAEGLVKLRSGQLVNHFPNHIELTRKDLLVKNIKRYERQHVRSKEGGASPTAATSIPDIVPATYALPQDYALFVEEFKKQPDATWILKPASKSQGKGIYLINKLSELRRQLGSNGSISSNAAAGRNGSGAQRGPAGQPAAPAAPAAAPAAAAAAATQQAAKGGGPTPPSMSSSSAAATAGALTQQQVPKALRPQGLEGHVVSRYIDNPLLLLGGKKFDLRLYVLVASYRPLVAYMSKLGFARFCTEKYSTEVAELENTFVHLTNVAVQKQSAAYNSERGNKWSLDDLQLHLESIRGHAATEGLFSDIRALVVHALKAVAPVMINDRHSFELLGFDVLIDDTLKPWLLEVNASPSLTTTTKADRLLKFRVISDTLDAITPPEWSSQRWQEAGQRQGPTALKLPGLSNAVRACGGRQTIGSLELLLDETADPAWLARARKEAAAAPAAPPPAPPILPSAQRALLQAGVRPQLVEPTKKVVLRG